MIIHKEPKKFEMTIILKKAKTKAHQWERRHGEQEKQITLY